MDTTLLSELARSGLLGVLLAISLAVLYKLQQQLSKLQEKRVEDANAVTDKLLELNSAFNDTMTAHMKAIDGMVKAVEAMESALRRLELAAQQGHRK